MLEVSTRVGLGQVVLVPAPDAAAPPGEIASIQFPASERCSASFVARRVPAGELVELEVVRPDAAPVSWRRPLDARDTAWLLGQELERPHGSAAFVRALRLLASILPDDDPL